jgi:hypothetical protein
MRESETFDAFYARTVSSVTSQMHALANGDIQADHAIREAYAQAYQQWYEVSGYRDAESWVLEVAKEAFQRRLAQAALAAPPPRDSGSWPGLFRQRQPPPAGQASADPAATVAGPGRVPGAVGGAAPAGYASPDPVLLAGPAQASQLAGDAVRASQFPAGTAGASQLPPLTVQASAAQPAAAQGSTAYIGGTPGDTAPASRAERRRGSAGWLGGNRTLVAAIAAIAVVAASIAAYVALGGSQRGHATSPGASAGPGGKPKVQMLPANQVGSRASVPWSLVGPGWSLAELSAAPPGSAPTASGGNSATYLVDPQGGRYLMRKWPASSAPALLAWSGDAKSALYAGSAAAAGSGAANFFVLTLNTGQVTALALPATVSVAGFTRPDGKNLLAVQQGPTRERLVRYDLQGSFQTMLSTMPRRPGGQPWPAACDTTCGALSSPDGTMAVWGAVGDEMQLVNNAGGLIRRLHVPHSGQPPSCTPISWWDTSTVLASCAATAGQSAATELYLVPDSGSSAQALTVASGTPAGVGYDTGAWQAGGQEYVTQTTATQCPQAASGPGGLEILRLASSGSDVPIAVQGSTGNHNVIVASSGPRLLVLAQTSCPGTTSLLWLNPATGATQALLTAPASQAGVVAAVPYGAGTAAAGN